MSYGKDLKQKGDPKSQRLFPLAVKGLGKVIWEQMWFDLAAPGTPLERINAVSVTLWKALTPKQQLRAVPPPSTIPDGLPAPAEVSEL